MAHIIITKVPATAINSEILNSVIGQMSDGIWENSPRMRKMWRGLSIETSNEGTLQISVEISSDLYYRSDLDVMAYFADKVKQIIKEEIKDGRKGMEWDRDNRASSDYLSYTHDVQTRDAYQVYDLLKNRIPKEKIPQEIPAIDIKVGDRLERYGSIVFSSPIIIENKQYIVIKSTYAEPTVLAGNAYVRRY